jgi:hypothetical protein
MGWCPGVGLSALAPTVHPAPAETCQLAAALFPLPQVNSETDFVARNAVFQDLVKRVAGTALTALPPTSPLSDDVRAAPLQRLRGQ